MGRFYTTSIVTLAGGVKSSLISTTVKLVSSPDPTPSAREKGSGDYGPFSWLC